MLTCNLWWWCGDILVFSLPWYLPEWWEGEGTSCSAILSFWSSWLTGKLEFLICGFEWQQQWFWTHIIGPFENSVVFCNVSVGFFKNFGRPSKDLVYAGVISGRKTKYIHLLEDTVLAILLRIHTVVGGSGWALDPGLGFGQRGFIGAKFCGVQEFTRLLCRACYERSVGENKRKWTQ